MPLHSLACSVSNDCIFLLCFWLLFGCVVRSSGASMYTACQVLTERFSTGCTHVVKKTYPGMQHSTCAQELDDVKDFLLSVIPEEETKPPTS